MRLITILAALAVAGLTPAISIADQFAATGATDSVSSLDRYLVAQADGDDSYDPFADYSEFEEASDEEADINFFRNGRFFTIGLGLGYRRFTNVMGEIYAPGTSFGGFLTYFFDLRFGLQVGYTVGDHALSIKTTSQTFNGTINMTSTSFHLKYFLSTQNITRGLSIFNPYLIGGFSQNYRTFRLSGTSAYARDGALGFDAGIGVEIPLMRNKMFIGAQVLYQLVNFSDENSEIQFRDDATGNVVNTGIYPRGDLFSASALIGVNF
ncbi:MAG TPA: outer membrane beta-barrel protein [Bdellovibrionales bacterium]|nr:outer membrane beta-barrel protein [Bdellovibrionales bacterium]